MIARRRDEGETRAVRAPLDAGPFAAPALDVVAERGAVLIGGICRRTTRGSATSRITRWIVVMTSSSGSGYFHAFAGWDVPPWYRPGTSRRRRADLVGKLQSSSNPGTTGGRGGRSWSIRRCQWPKSFTPSLVSCVSLPVATSRTQRLKSRIRARRFLSGERASLRRASGTRHISPPSPQRALWRAWRDRKPARESAGRDRSLRTRFPRRW